MAFYCNGKKGVCNCDILCADCKFYDDSGGKNVKTNADRIPDKHDVWCEKHAVYKDCLVEWLKQPPKGE